MIFDQDALNLGLLLLRLVVGIVLGQFLGSIPGLTAAMAVALLVPFSFYFDPWVGIPMMLAMFKGKER